LKYFIDVQGTLIDDIDKKPIKGAIEFIDQLNQDNVDYVIITNNTKKHSTVFLSYLQSLGFNIKSKNYLDPLMVLTDQVVFSSLAVYGHNDFIEVVKNMGYTLNYEKPEAVLIAIKEDFNNEEFAQMNEFLLNGASLIGMHETTLYAKNNKRYPGVGAILKMLSFATASSYKVIGKPSVAFYTRAKEILKDTDFKDITIISDDMQGDLLGAQALGMSSIFVLSGKFKNKEEILPKLEKKDYPSLVCQDMRDVLLEYQKGKI